MKTLPPAICIVGLSGAGKTILLEGLIQEMSGRGYRLATVKHSHHTLAPDTPAKDSFRHAEAGAEAVALASPGHLALFRRRQGDWPLAEVLALLAGFDLVLVEGYKGARAPKIEVCRGRPALPLEELAAAVSDEPLDLPIPCFSPDALGAIGDFIEGLLGLKPRRSP